jgi:F0F1-type ATP synthase assembly protein I
VLNKAKLAVENYCSRLDMKKSQALTISIGVVGLTMLLLQIGWIWITGHGTLYVGLIGLILLFISSLMANVLSDISK